MSEVNSARLRIGQNVTADKNITMTTDTDGNLIFNKGVYPTLTALAAFPNSGLVDYADDAAAATGGVAVGTFYRTGSAIKIRVS